MQRLALAAERETLHLLTFQARPTFVVHRALIRQGRLCLSRWPRFRQPLCARLRQRRRASSRSTAHRFGRFAIRRVQACYVHCVASSTASCQMPSRPWLPRFLTGMFPTCFVLFYRSSHSPANFEASLCSNRVPFRSHASDKRRFRLIILRRCFKRRDIFHPGMLYVLLLLGSPVQGNLSVLLRYEQQTYWSIQDWM